MKRRLRVMGLGALGVAAALAVMSARAEVTDQDKKFLGTAGQANYNEVAISKLAETKASNPKVKKFAETMVKDHTKLGDKMKPFADAWGLTLPTTPDADHRAELDKLSALSGPAFDKEYVSAMNMDHMKAEDLFKMELSSTTDPKFKKAVEYGEKIVSKHQNMIGKLEKPKK